MKLIKSFQQVNLSPLFYSRREDLSFYAPSNKQGNAARVGHLAAAGVFENINVGQPVTQTFPPWGRTRAALILLYIRML